MNFCPSCGSRIRPLLKNGKAPSFCERCGARLEEDEVRPQQAEVHQKRDLLGCFPYKTLRPFQKEALDQFETALRAGKKFIIFEAPVGFGKSAVAAALCNYLDSAYLLTSTKQLQDQYSADFGFSTVMGKSNFTCLVPTSTGKHLPCSKGRCEVDWQLSECPHYLTFEEYYLHERGLCTKDSKCERLGEGKVCTYYEQKWDAFRDHITIANYPFYLSELRFTKEVKHRKLLVCDEAHDLEKQMVSAASFSLKKSVLEAFQLDGERSSAVFIPDKGVDDVAGWREPLRTAQDALQQFVDAYISVPSMQDRVASCNAVLDSLEGFLQGLDANPTNWVVNSIRMTPTVDGKGASVDEAVFQPLSVSAYTSLLFDSADTILLMSATVFSKELFCSTLGIPEESAAFIRIGESSFPVENRRIHALNTVRLSWAKRDSSQGSIARAVDEIMTRHSDERGIIHTTSYQQANYIMEHVSETNRARLSNTRGVSSRSELLRSHGSTGKSVLISPSLYQGVDLKDDLSRFQVIVKVPFPDLSDRRTELKMKRDQGWYDWQTALRLVQTYGRSVRSDKDYAVTYVLDSNFTQFVKAHNYLFPEYFLEALA